MPRIPYRDANVLPAGLPPLNLFRMLAYSPSTLPHLITLGTAIFREASLSPHLRELLCLQNAKRLCCDYQWKQHLSIARQHGVTESQIAAIDAGDISSEEWSLEEKALLKFVDQLISGPEVAEDAFLDSRSRFSDQALVEIVTMQGYYYSLSRIATVFQVDLEQTSKDVAQRAIEAQNRK